MPIPLLLIAKATTIVAPTVFELLKSSKESEKPDQKSCKRRRCLGVQESDGKKKVEVKLTILSGLRSLSNLNYSGRLLVRGPRTKLDDDVYFMCRD